MMRQRSRRSPLLKLGGGVVFGALFVSQCFGGTILQQMRLPNFEEAADVAERVDVGTSAPSVSLPRSLSVIATAPYCVAEVTAKTTKRNESRGVQASDSLHGGAIRTENSKCE